MTGSTEGEVKGIQVREAIGGAGRVTRRNIIDGRDRDEGRVPSVSCVATSRGIV